MSMCKWIFEEFFIILFLHISLTLETTVLMIEIANSYTSFMSFSTDFSCLSCGASFPTSNDQRSHYKSEWHRYNLKRKISGLSSISKEDFDSKAEYYSSFDNTDEIINDNQEFSCSYCTLVFNSRNRLNNHLRSGKHDHLMNQQDMMKHDDIEISDEMQVEFILNSTICLFCRHLSEDTMKNVDHMISQHNFFIPDVEHLNDLNGLIEFCSEKIKLDWMCLYCDSAFNSIKAVQNHMLSKGHTMIGDIDMNDISIFFDFSQIQDEYMKHDQDAVITSDETELVFPNGKRIGHREFHRYYKQNLIYRTNSSNVKNLKWIPESHNQAIVARSDCIIHHGIDKAWLRQLSTRMVKLGVDANRLQRHFRHQIR